MFIIIVHEDGSITAPKIEGGYNHFVALKADGTVWTWGSNTYGELGLGNNTYKTKPEQAKYSYEIEDGTAKTEKLTDIIDVAAGYNFTLALKSDGTVWATGRNYYGQLGNGTTTDRNTFKIVLNKDGEPLENIIAITAGEHTSHALTADGAVYSWGYNGHGQFGVNNTSSLSYPVKMLTVENIIQISAGERHLTMLDTEGCVWSAGDNSYGQAGIGSTGATKVPTQMIDKDGNILYGVKEIATGRLHTVILKESGEVWTTGYNECGQLGNGTATTSATTKITQVKINADEFVEDAKHITAGGYATYISREKTSDGNTQGMYVMGKNGYGQLFTQDVTNRLYATEVETDKDILTMALTTNLANQTGTIVDQNGMVYTVGHNGAGEMGNGTIQTLTAPWCISNLKIEAKPDIINYKNIGEDTETITKSIVMEFNLLTDNVEGTNFSFTSMDETVATVDEEGKVTAKGIGATFVKVYNEDYKVWGAVKVNVNGDQGQTQPKIEGGYNHFVSLKADGTVWTWGYNEFGQLGVGEKVAYKNEPTQTNMKNVTDIAAGYYHTLVLKDGNVWAVGRNYYGQLGDGTTQDTNTFHKVKLNDKGEYLENIIAIAAGEHTSYALAADGTVYSWGYNGHGQLGVNNTSSVSYPVKMQKVSNIIQIAAGDNNLVMLDADGSVWTVGNNGYGQSGIWATSTLVLPTQMLDTDGNILYGVKETASGRIHTVILKENGEVWTTGYNECGQLGNGTTTTSATTKITQVKISAEEFVEDAKHITAGGYATYISREKTAEGNTQGMYVMGRNGYGQLFTQDATNRSYATEVELDKDILTMALTTHLTNQTGAIVDQDGKVYTVGYNGNGEMANGTVQSLTTPWCISELKIEAEPNIINFESAEQTEQITYKLKMKFNLLTDEIPAGGITFTSMDKSVATVDEDGIVTAKDIGSTFIKLYNERNNLYTAVKVNVNGENGQVQPKIVGGYNHFVALKSNGTVWTWGYNTYGGLGLGDNTNRTEPSQAKYNYELEDGTIETAELTDIIDVVAGYYHTLVLKSDGTVWATGRNYYGQLGDGTNKDRRHPTLRQQL